MTILAVLGLLLVFAGEAAAYPQFQLSTGNDTCKQCHFSPAGGGLINDYGRDESTSLSMWGGDGRFLHGAWTPPEQVPLGADLRMMTGYKLSEAIDEPVVFPMQMEVYARPQLGPVALYVNAGLRPSREGFAPGSREHYLVYEKPESSWYVRAGRFFPVFGLRTQDHTAYIRRHMQMYIYEEPYGVGFGRYGGSSELHVSAFVRSPDIMGTGRDSGVAAYWEQRNAESTAAYGAQARLSISDTDRRAWLGGVYKHWLEGAKLHLMGELNIGAQQFPDTDVSPHLPLVAYVSATRTLTQGLLLGATLQGFDPDVRAEAPSSRQAGELNLQWFPIPHGEIHATARYELGGWDLDAPVLLFLTQLHYYL